MSRDYTDRMSQVDRKLLTFQGKTLGQISAENRKKLKAGEPVELPFRPIIIDLPKHPDVR